MKEKIKIAIGPLILQKTGYGGVQGHIQNIIKYSKFNLKPIIPFMSAHSQQFKPVSATITTKQISFVDFYGLTYAKLILPNYDIIHLHGHPEWTGLYYKPKKRNSRYIHSIHGVYTKEDYPKEWEYRSKLNERMIESCKESDLVIGVAKWICQWIKEQGVSDAIYIPNGMNVEEFQDTKPDDFRKKYNLNDDFFLFAGRLDEYKRPKLYIKLAEKIKDKKFVMIGRDLTPEKVERYYGKNLPKNLKCIGEVNRKDLINGFSACRVFVLTSKYDTFPTVLMEAMACKKVVVGANNAGPKEIITDGKDGFLFEADDAADLIEKSLKAWENKDFGINGYKKVKEKFDWPVIVKKIDEEYEKLAGRK